MNKKPYHPDTYKRRTIRLPTHNYTRTAVYFVTLRAKQQEPVFDIPALRTILEETWHALPQRFPGITLDAFVIMPDHLHFILWLDGTKEDAPPLGRVIGAYKSLTTLAWLNSIKAQNASWPFPLWQRNYHERIIRDPTELESKRHYIRTNPSRLAEHKNTPTPNSTDTHPS